MSRTLVAALRTEVAGDVLADAGSRAVYSVDASNYRHVPTVVVRPRSVDDVHAAVAVAARHGVPITNRGAGTSVAGNSTGSGLVLDFSRYLDRVVSVDQDRRLATVQPGVVLDRLNDRARRHGLVFGPDPSTHSRCTLGGMIGNNACGAHSVAWGKTVHNVESLDVLLADSTALTVGRTDAAELAGLTARNDRVGRLYRDLVALRDETVDTVRAFPTLTRRGSGYNLDELLPERGFDLARALVGSEGTCVTVLGATVRLVPAPGARALVVLGFPDTYAAADQVPALDGLDLLAVEGIDAGLVAVVRRRDPGSAALGLLPEGMSWLFVETGGADRAEAADAARRVVLAMPAATGSVVLTDPAQQRVLWKIREEGAGLATRMADGSEAWSGWEDTAVPPERLGVYLREFDALLARHGRRGITYGHYGEGCLHVRIDFDLRSATGAAGYRAFLQDAADLVVSHGGSLSGEHGDGQARSELLPRMYPPDAIAAFGRFKAAFDPDALLNPGRIVDPLPLDRDLRVLVAPARIPSRAELALRADGGDVAAATRRCVGVGKCLNSSGGVMCPSYRVTREERHSTRGRARLLFEMLTGDVVRGGWRSREVRDALDLCLSCKGCKRDCPVDVDMATYKAEFLHRHYKRRLRPAAHYSMGFLPLWLALGQRVPRLVNAITGGPLGWLVKRVGGIAREREIPRLAARSLRSWFAGRPASTGERRVLLFPDTFTNRFDPEVGQDAVAVLERLGCGVELPRSAVCCGLTWMSTGQLGVARGVLRRTARTLRPWTSAGVPVVGLEPSCTAFLRSDALELAGDDEDVRALAGSVRTFAEQVAPDAERLAPAEPAARPSPAVVQLHCHQYAELGSDADRTVFAAAGLDATVLDAGCCGLAGNFGFERGHYEVSMACAEQALLPAVRAADRDTAVLADGFSCRTQLRQATDREPVHLATALARALGLR
nr:FAD-binding and (Fe-S)-binding domain-containing protein [Solihabitans fulvus]